MPNSFAAPAAADAAHRREFAMHVTAVERVLRESELLALGEFRCPVEHPQFAGGGPQACPYIVFSRTSVRIALDGRPEVRSPNTISLYNVGDVYARQPVSAEGDRCDWIALAPDFLREIGARFDPQLAHEPRRIFRRGMAPGSAQLYLAQRALFQSLREDPGLPLLAVEESAIRIVEAAFAQATSMPARRRARPRALAQVRSAAIVDATRAILAREFNVNQSIRSIAHRVHCSPGYLSRLFRSETGYSLHGFLQQLRLRASLELLHDACRDLSALALFLGYASHSHFTSVFRRQFGLTPTEFVRSGSRRRLREFEAGLAARTPTAGARAIQ